MMPINVALTLAIIVGVCCTVLSLVFITPKSKRDKLPGFFKFLHDLFNFKFLVLEKILKTLYIFCSIFAVAYGFFMIFSGYSVRDYMGFVQYRQSFAGTGLLVMILGPVAVRIVYEILMMSVLLLKNVMEINRRAKGDKAEDDFDILDYVYNTQEYEEFDADEFLSMQQISDEDVLFQNAESDVEIDELTDSENI